MKKNVILVVALIALMTGVLSAQTYDSENDFQVTKSGNAVTITKYVGTKTTVNIPPTIQNTPVTIIGNSAFSKNTAISNVIIPNSVKSIGQMAFDTCFNLKSVIIGSGVSNIDMLAFSGCEYLTNVTFQGNISPSNFSDNKAFLGDLRAKFYATDKNNGTPGTYTKNGTTWILATATTTAAPVASGTAGLVFTLQADGKAYSVSKGTVTQGAVVIPASYNNLSVTTIAEKAFDSIPITSVTIPNSVTTIGKQAFYGNSFTSITIPNSVTSIGEQAFYNCKNLTSVTIPNSVKNIGNFAFYGCAGLNSVTIGNGVSSIGDQVFVDCTNLTSVTFQGTIPSKDFNSKAFNGLGNLRSRFYATDKDKGTQGTYTRPNGESDTWTKK